MSLSGSENVCHTLFPLQHASANQGQLHPGSPSPFLCRASLLLWNLGTAFWLGWHSRDFSPDKPDVSIKHSGYELPMPDHVQSCFLRSLWKSPLLLISALSFCLTLSSQIRWPCLCQCLWADAAALPSSFSVAPWPSAVWLLFLSEPITTYIHTCDRLQPHPKCHFVAIHSPQCCQVFLYRFDCIISLVKTFANSSHCLRHNAKISSWRNKNHNMHTDNLSENLCILKHMEDSQSCLGGGHNFKCFPMK